MINDNMPTHDATRRNQSRYAAGFALPITMVDEPQQQERWPDLAKDEPGQTMENFVGRQRQADLHPLYEVFMAAIEQAMYGKGERHGGALTPFLDQPWAHYAKMHGRGFLTGQAAKKLEEAASTRSGLAFEQEVFGAMVYLGMAVLRERGEAQK